MTKSSTPKGLENRDIIEANPDLSDVLIFEGGEAVRIPIVETVETPETLPPWRR